MIYSNFITLASLLLLATAQAQAQSHTLFLGKKGLPITGTPEGATPWSVDQLGLAVFGMGCNTPNACEANPEKPLDITRNLMQSFSLQTFLPQRAILGVPDLNLNTPATSVVTVPSKSRALTLDNVGKNLTTVAPEPSAWLLIGIGLPALLGAARLRKRSA